MNSLPRFFLIWLWVPFLPGCFVTDVAAPDVSLGMDGRPVAHEMWASDKDKIAELERALLNLGPGVSKAEAQEVAHDAVIYPWYIVNKWDVQSPPQYQNVLVNKGKRPGGLCWQWADAMTALMRKKNLQTLDLHRAVSGRYTKDEHNVLVISAKGGDLFEGILIDPWRHSGSLHWSKVTDEQDPLYTWKPFYSLPKEQRSRRQVYEAQSREDFNPSP